MFFNHSTLARHEWLFITVLTSLLTIFLFQDALDGYWRFDDGFHLLFAVEYSPLQYFFDPTITRAQSGANVTPWNAFFYDINLSLFGFDPKGFYLHLLLLIIATALALYFLLRIWLPLPSSLLGVILFLLGKPTLYMAHELMCGHYLTGMLFSLLSLIFFIHYIRHGNYFKLFASLLLYALAITCKEIYVPLVAILLFIPAGHYKQRILALLPFALIVISYAFWRHAILGAWIGGYKSGGEINYSLIVEQLINIPFVLFSEQGLGLIAIVSITILSLAALKKRSFNIPLTLASLFIILIPLIPLILSASISQPGRYLFLPWVAICIWVATLFQSHKKNKRSRIYSAFSYICAIILISSSYESQKNETQQLKSTIRQAEDIYRFTMESDFSKKGLVINNNGTADEYWAYVSSFARHAYDLSRNIPFNPTLIITSEVHSIDSLVFLHDEIEVGTGLSSIQFYQYQHGVFSTIDIKPILHAFLDKIKAGKNQLLKVNFTYEAGLLSWDFHPNNTAYSAILWFKQSDPRYREIPLSKVGSYPWNIETDTQISLSFTSPLGWVAVSPKITIQPNQQKEIKWQGKSDVELRINRLESLLL